MIHSTAMFAGLLLVYHEKIQRPDAGPGKWLLLAAIVAMVVFYLLLVYAIATEVENTSLFLGFLGVLLSRLAGFFSPVKRHDLIRDMMRSFFSLGLFLIGAFVARYVPFPAGAVQGQ